MDRVKFVVIGNQDEAQQLQNEVNRRGDYDAKEVGIRYPGEIECSCEPSTPKDLIREVATALELEVEFLDRKEFLVHTNEATARAIADQLNVLFPNANAQYEGYEMFDGYSVSCEADTPNEMIIAAAEHFGVTPEF